MISTKLLGTIASFLYFAGTSIADHSCPPDGPLLSRLTALGSQAPFKAAGSKFSHILDSVVKGEIEAGFPIENTSFSISIASLDDNHEQPVWQYHHRGANNVKGTKKVDGDTQYLIGSISKVFTDLLLLKTGLNLEDPITKYLPELASNDSLVSWKGISLRALGAHLGGIQVFYGYPEMSYTVPIFEQLGFPKLLDGDFPKCGVLGMKLLAGLRDTAPVTTPSLRPAYSSISFTLLSYAMEAATGKNFTQYLDEQITKPLHLSNTGVSPGNDKKAAIPPIEGNSWGSDYGDNWRRSLLHNQRHVSIYRSNALIPDHPHTVDIYSKRGSAMGYEAYMGIIDQYGLGFTILTAGGFSEAATNLADTLLTIFLPAVEEAARSEAQKYVGSFTSSKEYESTIRTTIDNGPGLVLSNLTRNGSDIIGAIRGLWASQPVPFGGLSETLRLYPADVSRSVRVTECVDGKENTKLQVEEEWRLQYDIVSGNGPLGKLPSIYVVAGACGTFQTPGLLMYGGEALDRIVFVKEHGKVAEERRAIVAEAAAEAASKGPSPGQSLRRSELLAEKASYLKQFTALNIRIGVSKLIMDKAMAEFEEAKEEKRVLEEKYSSILVELGRIPAELSSPRDGMPRTERDDVGEEDKGGNVVKQEVGDMKKEGGGDVAIKEEEEAGDII
ncbi:hypothetical protein VE03_03283 [Pseudogymnoascus sp. 23342-1-I1]|nr:hypothetical protein VE03_03283 [Pseudogymnoascus sp. 23342-1-I1]